MFSLGATKIFESYPLYKICLFSIGSNPHIAHIKYPEGTKCPIFIVEDLSGLFAHPSIFLIKGSSQ